MITIDYDNCIYNNNYYHSYHRRKVRLISKNNKKDEIERISHFDANYSLRYN